MIRSADEFARLRRSEAQADYSRAAHESAPIEVWLDVIRRFPDLQRWVAYNKTVPVEILEELACSPDAAVRWSVAMKRKATAPILTRLSTDPDESVVSGSPYTAALRTTFSDP